MELRNRVVMPPMTTGFARGGFVTETMIDYHTARAKGGVGLIIVEDCTPLLNMATGKLTSEATGSVTITRDKVPGLTGTYRASMRGDFKMGADGSSLVFGTVHSEGSIDLTGGGAGFAGAKVKADVTASLDQFEYSPGKFTLRGPISIAGIRS